MKIAFGMHLQDGSFGGGNQFGKSLSSYLQSKGDEIFFDLNEPNLDIVLMTDPRTSLKSVSFGPVEIMKYIRNVNPNVIVVHRTNECDERKGTKTTNKQLALANTVADHTVFISSWLARLLQAQHTFTESQSVIKNGADPNIFTYQKRQLPKDRKIRLVTHHWSGNWKKGWDVYLYIDRMLNETNLGDRFEFHYIGNAPKNIEVKRIQIHPPRSGKDLAKMLQSCDVYITASLNEPAGMHHIEGALCGLPLLYRNSGALPEYCDGYGVMFNNKNDIIPNLKKLVDRFDFIAEKMENYPNTNNKMCNQYSLLFHSIKKKKGAYAKTDITKMDLLLRYYRFASKFNKSS